MASRRAVRKFLLAGLLALAAESIPGDAQAAPGWFVLQTPTNGAYVGATPAFWWSTSFGVASYTLAISPSTGAPIVFGGITLTSYAISPSSPLGEAGNPFTWKVTADDGTGSTTSTSIWSFLVDATPPGGFDLLSPPDGSWQTTAGTTFTWGAATDSGSGTSSYNLYFDAGTSPCGETSGTTLPLTQAVNWPCTGLSQGPHTWRVSALDAVGNEGFCNQATNGMGGRTVKIDDVGPGYTNGGLFEVNAAYMPDGALFDTGLTLNQGDTYTVTADGTWCTNACNSSTECFGPYGSNAGFSRPVMYCDFGQLMALVGGGNWQCIGGSGTVTADATGNLYLATDDTVNGGANCSSLSINVHVGVGPGLVVTSPPQNTSNPEPTFAWMPAADAGVGGVTYSLTIDGVSQFANASGTSFTLGSPLAEGTYQWTLTATDALGNSTSRSSWLTVDLTPPDPFSLMGPADRSCSLIGTPNLCWQGSTDGLSGLAAYELWIDGMKDPTAPSPWDSCATPTVPLAAGPHTWWLVAIDAAGNATKSTETWTVVVKGGPPGAFALTSPADGTSVYTDTPTFSWDAPSSAPSGIDHYELWLDGAAFAPNIPSSSPAYTPTSPITAGMHTWLVKAVDACGGTSSTTSFSVTVYECQPGASGQCPGSSVGACLPGTRTCATDATWGLCVGAVGPSPENCTNGVDDDCNGATDCADPACAAAANCAMAGGAGGGSSCDTSVDCTTCETCAETGLCANEINVCGADPDCVSLNTCYGGCTDQACTDQCSAMYGSAVPEYNALATCILCDACPLSCGPSSCGAGGVGGAGGGAGAGGSSGSSGAAGGTGAAGGGGAIAGAGGAGACDASGDCTTCQDCSTGGPCATAYNACTSSADCAALLNCYAGCGDQGCTDQCSASYPNGVSPYNALVDCVLCISCPVSCGVGPCGTAGAAGAAGSAGAGGTAGSGGTGGVAGGGGMPAGTGGSSGGSGGLPGGAGGGGGSSGSAAAGHAGAGGGASGHAGASMGGAGPGGGAPAGHGGSGNGGIAAGGVGTGGRAGASATGGSSPAAGGRGGAHSAGAGTGDGAEPAPDNTGGCGCRTAGNDGDPRAALVLLAAAGALARRRRRAHDETREVA